MERLRAILSRINWRFYQHPHLDKLRPSYLRAWLSIPNMTEGYRLMYNTLAAGWTRPDGREKVISKDQFRWQQYTNVRYNRELTKFMFSFRSDTTTTRNINNLLILTGPEGAGKSWFLAHNLRKMREAKFVTCTQDPKPLIIHLNLGQFHSLNFLTFLDKFETTIISEVGHWAETHKIPLTA